MLPPSPTDFTTISRHNLQDQPDSLCLADFANPDLRLNNKMAALIYQNHQRTIKPNAQGRRIAPLGIDLIELILDALSFAATFGWNEERPSPIVGRPVVGLIDSFSGIASNSGDYDNALVSIMAAKIITQAIQAADPALGPLVVMGTTTYLCYKPDADIERPIEFDRENDPPTPIMDDDQHIAITAAIQGGRPYPLIVIGTKANADDNGSVALDIFAHRWRRGFAKHAHPMASMSCPDLLIDSMARRPGIAWSTHTFNSIQTALVHQALYNTLPLTQLADIFVVSRVAAYLQRNDPDRAPTTTFEERIKRVQEAWKVHRDTSISLDPITNEISHSSATRPDIIDHRTDAIDIDVNLRLPDMPQ